MTTAYLQEKKCKFENLKKQLIPPVSVGRLDVLAALPGRAGYFTETFCLQSRFFQPKNGARVDAIREAISRKPKGHDFIIDRRHDKPAVARHMSVTGG